MSPEKVIVAVKAKKVITKTALAWALTHVVRPGDFITLLAVFPMEKTGKRKFWGFPRLKGHCRASGGGGDPTELPDRIGQISESCSQMVLQFHDQIDVRVRIKVVSATPAGVVAAEAKNNAAKWVILDKKLKLERRHCMEELRCNIVVMKGSQPKVLRLNLECPDEIQTPFYSATSSPVLDRGKFQGQRMKHSTPVSSPEEPSTSCTRTSGENALSSPDTVTSKFLVYQQNPLYERPNMDKYTPLHTQNGFDRPVTSPDSVREKTASLSKTSQSLSLDDKSIIWIPQNHKIHEKNQEIGEYQNGLKNTSLSPRTELHNRLPYNQLLMTEEFNQYQNSGRDSEFNSSIREAVSLHRISSKPPPLCSQCQQKAPAFGKPPRQFLYEELEEATDGFSDTNFLAEGGFGFVYRGTLRDGLVVAIKQLKFSGSQRDADFCREVRVLSCAQHRNVVLLIGFCVEQKKRLLVYEYICNGSLDLHLHGNQDTTLDWDLRLKIAIGTARGLRYLHEDCRVGCIIHRDLRPHNILLTHDFEPLVADFGLARLHSEWELCDGEQVVGTFGYLAPEYFNGAKVTEKVDIYAFGLVLLELITGQKTSSVLSKNEGYYLLENLYPFVPLQQRHLLSEKQRFLDSCLTGYELHSLPCELRAMAHAAAFCLQKDPDLRPPMSKVLRILEGRGTVIPLTLDATTIGSRSGHLNGLNSGITAVSRMKHSRRLSH